MKVIFGLKQIRKYRKPVIALGVFDGVHQGHRKILKAAVKKAHKIKGTSMVLTFRPHPQKQESLYSLEHRLRLIAELGIDICVVIKFSSSFSRISPENFIRQVLVKKCAAQYIYIGKNFRFGRSARGDFRLLKKFSRIFKFILKAYGVLRINGHVVSSSRIRSLIKKGEIKSAEKFLTRPVSVLGTVIRGASLARRLGSPTANINPHHEVLPPSGVYAVRIIFARRRLSGVCNIGTKPTFGPKGNERHIEAYIFNFRKNIYGKYLVIEFIKKIRNEKKFDSPFSLTEQIKKDTASAKAVFSRH